MIVKVINKVSFVSIVLFIVLHFYSGCEKIKNSILKTNSSKLGYYDYLLYLPAEYELKQTVKWPAILDLHGAGQRGNDLIKLKQYGMWRYLQFMKNFPFIVLLPQCPQGERWETDKINQFLELAIQTNGEILKKLF